MTFLYYSDDGAKVTAWKTAREIPKEWTGVVILSDLKGTAYARIPELGMPKWTRIQREDVPKYVELLPKEGTTDIPLGLPIPADLQHDVYVLAAYEQLKWDINYDTALRDGRATVLERVRRETAKHFKRLATNARLSVKVLLFFITGSEKWRKSGGKWTLDEMDLECGMTRYVLRERMILPVAGAAVFWDGLSVEQALELIVYRMALHMPLSLSQLVTGINTRKRMLPTKSELAIKHYITGIANKMSHSARKRKKIDDGYSMAHFRLPPCLKALNNLNYHARLLLANHVLWMRHSHVDRFASAQAYLLKVFTPSGLKKIGAHSQKDFFDLVTRDAHNNKLPMAKTCYSIRNGKDPNVSCPYASNGECVRALGKKESGDYALTPIKVAVLEYED